jgi:predicted DNA-binding transcriptional regulator AlpA
MVKEERFPPPKKISRNAVGWRQSIVTGYGDSCPDARALAA